jgi:DNA-damage-inducible protein J
MNHTINHFMASKTSTVRARLDPKLKEETELIFNQLGISTTDAIRIFFTQVKLNQGLPFEMKVPNKVTQKAIKDAQERHNLTESANSTKLFDELGI